MIDALDKNYSLKYNYLPLKNANESVSDVKNIVVMLHGYGSEAEKMSIIPEMLNIPNTLYILPDGPEVCKGNEALGVEDGVGRQWFDLVDFNLSEISGQLLNQLDSLNLFIGQISQLYNVPVSNIVVFGFSQGSFMASHFAFVNSNIAGTIGSSGGVFANIIKNQSRTSVPMVLTHGLQDNVLSHEWSEYAYEVIRELNDNISLHLIDDVEHVIEQNTLKIIKASIVDMLKLNS